MQEDVGASKHLLSIFQSVAHKLDLQTAVELDTLVPVRCVRIATNIELRDVRINGFRYNALDLESKIMIPGRNQLIVDTYCEYVKNKPTVVFCTSVKRAQELAALFQAAGVDAHSVSGSTKPAERKRILEQNEQGAIPVLCACDLLNEDWDSPHIQVVFMARPTMSKTIYMQQLGRGMRKCPGKEFLMVFDKGLIPEKKPCLFTKGGYTDKDVERLILSMPFKRFEDMDFSI